jgi:GT2 family glycosyltransferase
MTRIRVVVVNHDGGEVTLRCLDALRRTEWPADALEVVLVDNASADGVAEEVWSHRPGVRVIRSSENEGFGRACNRAMADLDGVDHIALVNNDAVPEPGWLTPLVEALEHDGTLGAVCPKVLLTERASPPERPYDVINSVGGVLYEGWFGGDRGYLEPDRGQYDEPVEVFSWSGAAVLLRGAYLRDVGLFNPDFFLYYEDFELSWRGRLRGWRYQTVPTSVVWHQHGYSTGIGSARFHAWEDRSRRLTLIELAPWPVALRALAGGIERGLRRLRTEEKRPAGLGAFAPAATRAGVVRWRLRQQRKASRADIERWLLARPASW